MTFTIEEEYLKVEEWCLGNKDAARLLMDIYEVTQIADDFVDRDVPLSEIDSGKMLRLLHLAMVDIPTNSFYLQYSQWLIPLMSSSLLIWDATETWKKSKEIETRMFAYTYREICEQFNFVVANILGGLPHAKKVIQETHEFYHGQKEGREDILLHLSLDRPSL